MEISVPSLLRVKSAAFSKLGKYCSLLGLSKVSVFWGEGLQARFSEKLQSSLTEYSVELLSAGAITTNDCEELFGLSCKLPAGCNGLVAIGGGRVIDACKYIAHLRQLSLLACPTIVSNDGFCSPFSSLIMAERRQTLPTRLPKGVVVDIDIVQGAPQRFFFSGVGDLISNITAIWDWKQAYHQSGLYVDDFAVSLAQSGAENFIHHPQKSHNNLKCLSVLSNGLLLSGIAMEVAGSSRPASGSEHLISHGYDTTPASKQSSHGLQVGVAAYAMSILQGTTREIITTVLTESGFVDYMQKHPLDKLAFEEAVGLAPEIKPNFHTILNEAKNRKRLIELCQSDNLLQSMLK